LLKNFIHWFKYTDHRFLSALSLNVIKLFALFFGRCQQAATAAEFESSVQFLNNVVFKG